MAQRAILRGRDMADMLDCRYCSRTIVAGGAVIYDTGMIEHRVQKGAGYVTETAILCGRDVADILPGPFRSPCRNITVTCCAVIHDAGMIKGAIGEIVANCMTRSTIGSRGRMRLCRLRLSVGSGCNITTFTIMARLTIVCDARMREVRRCRSKRNSI